jgi:hypothetical protein
MLSGGPLIANARRTSSALGQSNTVAASAARVVGAEKEARRPLMIFRDANMITADPST